VAGVNTPDLVVFEPDVASGEVRSGRSTSDH
jgi:hypothetical protein